MWYLRLILLVLVNVAVALFALANIRETVILRWWSTHSTGTPVNLTAALLVAYLLGFLTFLAISAIREMRLRRRCSRLEREMRAMREELNALRTAPLEGALSGEVETEEGERGAP